MRAIVKIFAFIFMATMSFVPLIMTFCWIAGILSLSPDRAFVLGVMWIATIASLIPIILEPSDDDLML